MPQNIKDTENDMHGKQEVKYKCPSEGSNQSFFSVHSSELYERHSKSQNHKGLNDIPKSHNFTKYATLMPLTSLSQQQEATHKFNPCELTRDKISKLSTPMLYHLTNGSSLVMLNASNQNKQLDTIKQSNAINPNVRFFVSRTGEPQKPIHKTRSQLQLEENVNHFNECDSVGSLTSSIEEKCMLDYKENLKTAQKKVLRETSKRRDLQMNLPVRLKLNPSKRPSIDHKRSQSLSSTNENAKVVSPNISAEDYEMLEKATVSQIGARKRLTNKQNKLCYSEPEKLDHLGVHKSIWNSEESGKNQSRDHLKLKPLEHEQTRSSSNVSKPELKQIQHNVRIEYMERKTNQRPRSVYQTRGEKTFGSRPSLELKCLTEHIELNEKPHVDYSPKYCRRRTGASLSYDATVTWNDRPLTMFHYGANHPADNTAKTMTCDPYSLEIGKTISKELSTSDFHNNDHSQTEQGHACIGLTTRQGPDLEGVKGQEEGEISSDEVGSGSSLEQDQDTLYIFRIEEIAHLKQQKNS
ncbi:LOW QUALITY PROTEIN: protein Shroom1 [Gastrophryne carolinensis]